MNCQYYEKLDEQVYRTVLSNGLTVQVVPRPGFQRKLAYFAVDFGSIHRHFRWKGAEYTVPAGIAHFLEHKMFDMPERDISGELAELGACVNAFTSYDMTAYYFSCTQNFETCLDRLLEFVSTPYFTKESVEKEQGIIDQEINMNMDAPLTYAFEKLMEGMYRDHDIRTPILGTSESIRQITPELLTLCHQAFYTPGNMVLTVVGDVEPEKIVQAAYKQLGTTAAPVGEKIPDRTEEMTCHQPYQEITMDVAQPAFQMAFKCEPIGNGPESIRQEMIGELAADVLLGESSKLYLELYDKGIIDTSFGGCLEMTDGGTFLSCGGECADPLVVKKAILDRVELLKREGVEEAEFRRIKRSAMGQRIRQLDSADSVCFRLCAYHFSDFDYFRFPEIYEAITADDVQRYLAGVISEERCGIVMVKPIEEEE